MNLAPMHHGNKPLDAPHSEVESIRRRGVFGETLGHVTNVCLRDVEEIIEAVEPTFGDDGVTVLDIGETDPL